MQKHIRPFLDFLLFSNLFIALGAAAQVILSYQLLELSPNWRLISLVFCATLALYNFSMFLARPAKPESSPYRRVRWIFEHQRLITSISLTAIFGAIILSLLLSYTSQILLLFLGFIAIAYNLPLLQIRSQKIGLRNIPGIKLFLIAGIWSLSVVLLPVLEAESKGILFISSGRVMLLLAQRFAFVAAITIPFDIRDLYQDRIYALKTIPVLFGETKAYLLCQLLLVVSLVLSGMALFPLGQSFSTILITSLLSAWLIFRSKWKKDEYYYFFYLDGVLLIPTVCLALLQFIC
ncbi:MAG: hypothetical protein ACKOW2_02405 [Sphingobacteriaceae bacterium]